MGTATDITKPVPGPIIHIFRVSKSYSTVKHYELIELIGGFTLLTEQINISRDRGFAKSDPEYWLSPKPDGKWVRLTGLFATSIEGVYIGDRGTDNKKEDTILVKFNDRNDTVVVYYFQNYYTKDIRPLLPFLKPNYLKEKRGWKTTLF